MFALIQFDSNSRMPVKVVLTVLAAAVDQQVFLFVYEIEDIVFAEFEIGCQLNCESRTRLLTEASVNTPRKVDPEPQRIPTPVFSFRAFHGNAVRGANGFAKIAGDASFLALRIPRQNDPKTRPGRERPFEFRILLRNRLPEEMLERDVVRIEHPDDAVDHLAGKRFFLFHFRTSQPGRPPRLL